mgnify:FL=1
MNLKYKKSGLDHPTSPSQHHQQQPSSNNNNNKNNHTSLVMNHQFHRAGSEADDRTRKDLKRLISGGPSASTRVTYIDLCSNPVSGNMIAQ